MTNRINRVPFSVFGIIWAAVFFTAFIWSAVNPADHFTWFLEVLPAAIGAILLLWTYPRFTLTPLLYVLVLLHCIILLIGGHYTYAEVPLFSSPEFMNFFGFERNNYDKVGHFAQGFVPAIIAREIYVRNKVVSGRAWLNFNVICVALAVSAFYELIEWWVALASGESAEAFLGTQGFVWDTQSDMGMALLGALVALIAFGRWHDRQLATIEKCARK